MEINIKAENFQEKFAYSPARFPSMVAGWGTGKTMLALYRGIYLSQEYDNNLGVIVRSKFTDLRDSTMTDFTRYTGKTVPQGTKEAKFVNGSRIYFRHAKELSGLQNVNLGWFYIEQAEEFPTSTQFDLLRGRLRRVLTPKLEVQERLLSITSEFTGMPALKEVVGNWQYLSKRAVDKDGVYILHPELKDNPNIRKEDKYMKERDVAELALSSLGITLRQGMVIANANGHNWVWKMFIKSPQDGYSCTEANSFDNAANLPADTIADWQAMKKNSPAKYKQYVMNSHDEIDLDACYYADSLNQLRRMGRIGDVPHDPSVRVHLAGDIGFDCTALWFFQLIGRKKLFIDYYENTGKPIKHYVEVLDRKKRDFGYNYGRVIMPHDANKREMVAGTTLSKALRDMGYDVKTLPREQNIDFGINNVINTLSSCWFDETKCELGLEALNHYRRTYNEELKVYEDTPLHDWASHPADSMRYACKAIKKNLCGASKSISDEDIAKFSEKWRRTG